jgi:hypothetical protein
MSSLETSFIHAQRLWGKLDKHEGICFTYGLTHHITDVPWLHYDFFDPKSAPPALCSRFRRALFVDHSDSDLWVERFKFLKVLNFYLGNISQAIVTVGSQDTQVTIDQCLQAKFNTAVRIAEHAVLVYKF